MQPFDYANPTTINEALDLLADHPPAPARPIGLRIGVAAAAAMLGAWLAVGHGAFLP